MNRESQFEKYTKFFIYGAAGVGGLCHLLMLFTEFKAYSGAGMLFNALFHLITAVACALIVIIYYKNDDNKEVYSGYLLGIQSAFGAIVDICLLVRYISYTKNTTDYSVALIVFIVILTLLELLLAFLFVRYGLDKITCILPMIVLFISSILRGIVYGKADSGISIHSHSEQVASAVEKYAASSVGEKIPDTVSDVASVYSVWTFLSLVFILTMVISIFLYLDNAFLSELIQDPKSIFTKKAIYGTYSNLFNEKPASPANVLKKEKEVSKQVVPEVAEAIVPKAPVAENIISDSGIVQHSDQKEEKKVNKLDDNNLMNLKTSFQSDFEQTSAELVKYKQLYDDGALSDEEFSEIKKRLLGI